MTGERDVPVDGAGDAAAAGRRVRAMFDRIARRYDLLNRVLSAGVDRRWRRAAAEAMRVGPGDIALDVAAGTGDLAAEIAARGARAVGVDFSSGMLGVAAAKAASRGLRVALVRASACDLPFADGAFAAAGIAFGIRNIPDRRRALAEMRRVVRPGGRVVVLEPALPRSRLLRRLYAPWFSVGLPLVGGALSDRSAYRYLRDSIAAFPDREAFLALMADAKLRDPSFRDLSGGLAVVYSADAPGRSR